VDALLTRPEVDVNKADSNGYTPLIYALENTKNQAIVEALLREERVDINKKSPGETALDVAKRKSLEHIITLLENDLRLRRSTTGCDEDLGEFSDGRDYNGCQDTTISGYKCKNWEYNGMDHNFCRNFNGAGQIWCYLENGSGGAASERCEPKSGSGESGDVSDQNTAFEQRIQENEEAIVMVRDHLASCRAEIDSLTTCDSATVNAAIRAQGFFPHETHDDSWSDLTICRGEGLRRDESCSVTCKANELITTPGTAKCVEGKVEVESPKCSRAPSTAQKFL
jgi:hypothetical protein